MSFFGSFDELLVTQVFTSKRHLRQKKPDTTKKLVYKLEVHRTISLTCRATVFLCLPGNGHQNWCPRRLRKATVMKGHPSPLSKVYVRTYRLCHYYWGGVKNKCAKTRLKIFIAKTRLKSRKMGGETEARPESTAPSAEHSTPWTPPEASLTPTKVWVPVWSYIIRGQRGSRCGRARLQVVCHFP